MKSISASVTDTFAIRPLELVERTQTGDAEHAGDKSEKHVGVRYRRLFIDGQPLQDRVEKKLVGERQHADPAYGRTPAGDKDTGAGSLDLVDLGLRGRLRHHILSFALRSKLCLQNRAT